MHALLHADHTSHEGVFHFLTERLGGFGRFLDEVVWHGFLDTVKLVLFLFLTYLLMEFIEHKASSKVRALMTKAGEYGMIPHRRTDMYSVAYVRRKVWLSFPPQPARRRGDIPCSFPFRHRL